MGQVPDQKAIEASNYLEELAIIAKHMVAELRSGTERHQYAAVYWLRRELGYVCANLGAGAPKSSVLDHVAGKYQTLVDDSVYAEARRFALKDRNSDEA